MILRLYILVFLATMFSLSVAKGQKKTAPEKYLLKKGGVAVLEASTPGASSYIWYRNNVLLTGETAAKLSVRQGGLYKVIAQSAAECQSEPTEIEIEEMRDADVAITKKSEERDVFSGQSFSYYLNARNNGPNRARNVNVTDILPEGLVFESLASTAGNANYDSQTRTLNWLVPLLERGSVEQLEIKVNATVPGKVSNTATLSAMGPDPELNNNTSTDHKQIEALRVHNVFTPNGDGKNDTFLIDNLEDFDENELTIINRWQSTVFQAKNYKNDWNGSQLNSGTYFYVIKVRKGNLPWIEQKGYVTLLRQP